MYINETHIAFYAIAAILGLFVGMLVDWMNKRLPEYKKVFCKDIATEYLEEFKPNYILMLVTSLIYIALVYFYGIRNTFIANLDLIKFAILTPMLLSAFVIDFKLQIIPNRLNLTMFEIGLVIAFIYGLSDVAITINMILGMITGGGIFLAITLIGRSNIWKRSNGIWRCKTNGSIRTIFWTIKYNSNNITIIFNRSNIKHNIISNKNKENGRIHTIWTIYCIRNIYVHIYTI